MQDKKNIEKVKSELESWFFWFWTKNLRVSFLTLFLLIIGWIYALVMIPKESSPKVDLWYISITTVYTWVSPTDINSLITEELEKKIKDVKWVKKYTSDSSVWVSNIVVEVEVWKSTKDVMTDIKSEVDKVKLPSGAETPSIIEIENSRNLLFQLYLYWDGNKYSNFDMIQKAKALKQDLESKSYISSVTVSPAGNYQIKVLVDKSKIEQLWVSLSEIWNAIRINNRNTPIWNFAVWDLNYDFRFQWELSDVDDLKNVIVRSNASSTLKLSDLAEIEVDYKTKEVNRYASKDKKWQNYVVLLINKADSAWVFSAAASAKSEIEKQIKENQNFEWIWYSYGLDLSDYITKDYSNLASTARQTLLLVFITILFFVGFKDSVIATVILPLSFFVTFIYLYYFWYTLNFLTNFSLVLSLTIWIDTIIVIIEWASERQKLWYSKKYAILWAIQDFKAPLISGTLTTLVVFLPMMVLPWVMWKFLAYIPITVFSTLLAWLVIALTISSAVYMAMSKDRKTYRVEEEIEANMTQEQKDFLESQREWKTIEEHKELSFREKALAKMWKTYFNYLNKSLKSKTRRFLIILTPIVLTVLSFVVLSPLIWYNFYTWDDLWNITLTVKWKEGSRESVLSKYLPDIEKALDWIPEIDYYGASVSWSKITTTIQTIDKKQRKKDEDTIAEEISTKLASLSEKWLNVTVEVSRNWPPSSWPIWIKLVSSNSTKLEELKKVVDDFEKYLKSVPWAKNVTNTSSDTPWQFIFKFDENKLSQLWLTSNDILWELASFTNWVMAWSIKSKYEDNDIIIKIKDFENNLSPDDLLNVVVTTKAWKVRVWDVASYDFTKSVSTINRENWKIMITVKSDLKSWYNSTDVQPKLNDFAKKYVFPEGIYYEQWWDNAENAELIAAMISSLFVAIFLMFFILVIQFNSYKQPWMILFSIILSLLWVNIWLFITGTPYWMMMMIWFIAMAWVVINDAIILIDLANKNIARWIEPVYAIATTWQSRLQPILVTTITTVLWVWPMAAQWWMWSWFGYTIMFGILAWSLLTIYCIPLIYYNSYLKEKEGRKWIILKIILLPIWLLKKIYLIVTYPFRKKKK